MMLRTKNLPQGTDHSLVRRMALKEALEYSITEEELAAKDRGEDVAPKPGTFADPANFAKRG